MQRLALEAFFPIDGENTLGVCFMVVVRIALRFPQSGLKDKLRRHAPGMILLFVGAGSHNLFLSNLSFTRGADSGVERGRFDLGATAVKTIGFGIIAILGIRRHNFFCFLLTFKDRLVTKLAATIRMVELGLVGPWDAQLVQGVVARVAYTRLVVEFRSILGLANQDGAEDVIVARTARQSRPFAIASIPTIARHQLALQIQCRVSERARCVTFDCGQE
jgi:hypothetical protein